jgi:hypothetical protein
MSTRVRRLNACATVRYDIIRPADTASKHPLPSPACREAARDLVFMAELHRLIGSLFMIHVAEATTTPV